MQGFDKIGIQVYTYYAVYILYQPVSTTFTLFTVAAHMRQTRVWWIYLIGSQRLMLTLRQRLTEQLFPQTKTSKKRLLLAGGMSAWVLLIIYPKLISFIADLLQVSASSFLYTSLTAPFDRIRAWIFCLYLLVPVLGIAFFFHKKSSSSFSYTLLFGAYGIGCVIIFLGSRFNMLVPALLLVGYLCIAASSEELLKFLSTYRLFHAGKTQSFLNDLLPYSLLSAYWFARFENIIYLLWQISHTAWAVAVSDTFLSLSLGRGIFGFLLHGIFSWSIAYIIQKHMSWQHYISWQHWYIGSSQRSFLRSQKRIVLGFVMWVLLHFLYNTLLSYNLWRGVGIFLLLTYAWTTYFLYNSNRLYIPNLSTKD